MSSFWEVVLTWKQEQVILIGSLLAFVFVVSMLIISDGIEKCIRASKGLPPATREWPTGPQGPKGPNRDPKEAKSKDI